MTVSNGLVYQYQHNQPEGPFPIHSPNIGMPFNARWALDDGQINIL